MIHEKREGYDGRGEGYNEGGEYDGRIRWSGDIGLENIAAGMLGLVQGRVGVRQDPSAMNHTGLEVRLRKL